MNIQHTCIRRAYLIFTNNKQRTEKKSTSNMHTNYKYCYTSSILHVRFGNGNCCRCPRRVSFNKWKVLERLSMIFPSFCSSFCVYRTNRSIHSPVRIIQKLASSALLCCFVIWVSRLSHSTAPKRTNVFVCSLYIYTPSTRIRHYVVGVVGHDGRA